jgi:hypothetical protein
LHVTELAALCHAHVTVCVADGYLESAQSWLQMLSNAAPTSPFVEICRDMIGDANATSEANRVNPPESKSTADRIDWKRALRGVPAEDWLDSLDREDGGDIGEAVESLLWNLERGPYLTWEAVIHEEQDLPLSDAHLERLDQLISFSEDEDDPGVLYIDERARPTEPWYASLRRVAAKLVVERFDTTHAVWDWMDETWPRIVQALEEHAVHLELPPGVGTPLDAVPAEIRHKLSLQSAFISLAGLGEYPSWVDGSGQGHVEDFLEELRDQKESVEHLGLSVERLLETVLLPPAEEPLFVEAVCRELGLTSVTEAIASKL